MATKHPHEWSPRDRLEFLEKLARDLVGDGKEPNLFFVSSNGNIILISRDFEAAYRKYREHARTRDHETALEDRKTGVIASVEPVSDEPDAKLIEHDDSRRFGFFT
jgi:hypothetical protein